MDATRKLSSRDKPGETQTLNYFVDGFQKVGKCCVEGHRSPADR